MPAASPRWRAKDAALHALLLFLIYRAAALIAFHCVPNADVDHAWMEAETARGAKRAPDESVDAPSASKGAEP
jgi:hypothetical protein